MFSGWGDMMSANGWWVECPMLMTEVRCIQLFGLVGVRTHFSPFTPHFKFLSRVRPDAAHVPTSCWIVLSLPKTITTASSGPTSLSSAPGLMSPTLVSDDCDIRRVSLADSGSQLDSSWSSNSERSSTLLAISFRFQSEGTSMRSHHHVDIRASLSLIMLTKYSVGANVSHASAAPKDPHLEPFRVVSDSSLTQRTTPARAGNAVSTTLSTSLCIVLGKPILSLLQGKDIDSAASARDAAVTSFLSPQVHSGRRYSWSLSFSPYAIPRSQSHENPDEEVYTGAFSKHRSEKRFHPN